MTIYLNSVLSAVEMPKVITVDPAKLKLKISEMTGKLAHIRAISTNTLTNPFCQKMQKTDAVCKSCYSQRMLEGLRRNCAPAWEQNSKLLSEDILPAGKIPVIKDDIFRIMAHGELINETSAINLMNIVKSNPKTLFAWWTKRINLVKDLLKDKPANLVMIYSNPKVDDPSPVVPENFDKVFSVYSKTGSAELGKIINCGALSCRGCMKCYTHNATTHVNELLK
jgi:hypothetical protein